jgi:hypothetical protein
VLATGLGARFQRCSCTNWRQELKNNSMLMLGVAAAAVPADQAAQQHRKGQAVQCPRPAWALPILPLVQRLLKAALSKECDCQDVTRIKMCLQAVTRSRLQATWPHGRSRELGSKLIATRLRRVGDSLWLILSTRTFS